MLSLYVVCALFAAAYAQQPESDNEINKQGEASSEPTPAAEAEELPTWTMEVVTKSSPVTFQFKYYELRATSSNGDVFDIAKNDLMSMLRWWDDVDQWWNEQPVYEPVEDDEGQWQLSFREWIIWNTGTGEFMQWDYDYYSIEDIQSRLNRCSIQFKIVRKDDTWLNCRGDGNFMAHADAKAVYDSAKNLQTGQVQPDAYTDEDGILMSYSHEQPPETITTLAILLFVLIGLALCLVGLVCICLCINKRSKRKVVLDQNVNYNLMPDSSNQNNFV